MERKTLMNETIATLERALSLLVVFLLLAATVVPLGRLFGHPFGPAAADEAAAARPDTAALAALGLADARLTQVGTDLWAVASATGNDAGMLAGSCSRAADVTGFAGPTPVYVYINKEGRVAGVAAGPHAETPAVFRHVEDEGFLRSWNGLTPAEAQARQVDAVSGATYTSRALARNVGVALEAYAAAPATTPAPDGEADAFSQMAPLVVVMLGVGAALLARRSRTLRLVVLVLNVGVTGFWCGEYLSVSLLRSWLAEGADLARHLPAIVMLAVSLLLAFLKKPNHYCTWICPLGSLQELAYRLPGPKLRLPQRAFHVMERIRLGVLVLLLLALWMGVGAEVLSYEPFAAFSPAAAPWPVLVLAGAFVVLGVFVPRPWCKALCPLGELFRLSCDASRKS